MVIGLRAAPLLAGLSGALVAGCSGKMFRPVTPRMAVDSAAAVKLDGIYVTHMPGSTFDENMGVRLGLEVDARAPVRIGEARLTTSLVPPCASGIKATQIVSANRYGPGPETITLAFSRPAVEAAHVFVDRSAVLDLTVFPAGGSTAGRCIRIAVVEPGGPPDAARWVHRAFLFGGEERVMFVHSQIPRLENLGLVLAVGMGAWHGRWRWMLAGEGGFVGRADTTGGQAGMRPFLGLWGGSASASTLVFDRGRFGLGTIAGYEVLRAVPGGPASVADPTPTAMTLHGPRIGLQLLYLIDPLAWPGFESPRDAFVGGLTLYVGNWWSGTDLGRPSPFLAISIEGNLGF